MLNRATVTSAAVIAAVALAALTGCTAPAEERAETPEPETVDTVVADEDLPGTCTDWSAIRFAPTQEGATTTTVSVEGPDVLTDHGATKFANGTVELNDQGLPVTYTVAEGDAPKAIGVRFCVDYITLLQFNHIYPTVHPGDVLTLIIDQAVPFELEQPSGAAESPAPALSFDPCREKADGTIIEVAQGETLDPALFARMEDLGPREGANGTVRYAEDGTLAAYAVAPGDSIWAVANRVCTSEYGMEALNAVRRNNIYADLGDSRLFEGDTLNLSPYTITSVGDQGGVVYEHTPYFTLPPQR